MTAIQQYDEMKRKHPDAVLLFRIGDFYETFKEDAITTSEILGITLTRRANGKDNYIELAGFPHHALDTYLPKLVRAGKRVAICEQLEDPKRTKIAKRPVATPIVERKEVRVPDIHILTRLLAVFMDLMVCLSKFYKLRDMATEYRNLSRELKLNAVTSFDYFQKEYNENQQLKLF